MRKDLVDYKMDAREWEKAIDDFVIGKNAQQQRHGIFSACKRHGVRQSMENHSGIDGDFASHKSTAICWRYQKAKGITKKEGSTRKKVLSFLFIRCSPQTACTI